MPQKRLNILFLSSWYPSKAHPTLGNFVQRHAEAVATLHNVTVLYVTFLDGIEDELKIVEGQSGEVKEVIVYCKRTLVKPVAKRKAFKNGISYLEDTGQFNFDLVHMNVIWNSGWQALWLKKKFDLPYILTEHWTGFAHSRKKERHPLLRILAKRITRNAKMICPVSHDLEKTMKGFGLGGSYKVVPNVVDTALFQIKEKDSDRIHFLHVSSLVDEHKNITGILRAWKKASQKNMKIHLTLGGDGPWQHWQNVAESMQISKENIAFYGEKTPSGIAELMSSSHCLLLFSNYENMPVVISEALASGMAVISSDVGGIREHINSDRGYLVKKKDEDALASAILKFAVHHKNFNQQELRNYAVENFSVASVARAFNNVYGHHM